MDSRWIREDSEWFWIGVCFDLWRNWQENFRRISVKSLPEFYVVSAYLTAFLLWSCV